MRVETADNGDITIWFRQSSINDFLMCPEKARQTNFGLVDGNVDTDATITGTAWHSAIEYDITCGYSNPEEMRNSAIDQLYSLATPETVWRGSIREAVDYLAAFSFAWFALPLRREMRQKFERGYLLVEEKFDVPLFAADGVGVRLEGTPDIVDLSEQKIIDWKTVGRGYMRWEKQRWAIQPSVYATAARLMGWVDQDEIDFDFVQFLKKPDVGPEVLTVRRDRRHDWWLIDQLKPIVNMIVDQVERRPLDEWPKNDAGWWCSADWCPVFKAGKCKGAHVDDIRSW